MIVGAHTILHSNDAEADRAFFRDILGFRSVDAGGGWLIFSLPSSELAVHPAPDNNGQQLYLMCDDLRNQMVTLKERGIHCSDVHEEPWGSVTKIMLPGGGELGLYQPKHPTAL